MLCNLPGNFATKGLGNIYILFFLDKVTLALWWDDDLFWQIQLECSVVFSSQTVRKLKNIMKLS